MSAAEAAHPHELRAAVPDRLPAEVVRRLSKLEPRKALGALAAEWIAIAATIAVALWVDSWWLYPFAVVFIGARQHALTVIGHDAAHWRFLPDRRQNDLVADVFAQWPVFITVAGFRKFHGEHHQHLGTPDDGNRFLWGTHFADGSLTPEWSYPKRWFEFAFKILRRAAFFTGLRWILRGLVAGFLFARTPGWFLLRVAWLAAVVAGITLAHGWTAFLLYWVVPYCTWHMAAQYVRLVCEHSAIPGEDPAWRATRTTVPRAWERLLVVPRGISYHIEHHWYPTVPFYNLPALHDALMARPEYRANAVVTDSIVASVRQVLR